MIQSLTLKILRENMESSNILEMVLASLEKIWHLVPIVIAVLLFKKFITTRDRKRRIEKNLENENKGLTIKHRTINKYEKLGYKIEEINKSQNLDLICTKDEKSFIMQLNNALNKKTITAQEIEDFINKGKEYIKANNLNVENIEFRYVIPYTDMLEKSAVNIFADDNYKCKYMIL